MGRSPMSPVDCGWLVEGGSSAGKVVRYTAAARQRARR